MISRDIVVKSNVGLHARPAMFFIQKANSYKSSIWIQVGDKRSSAKSLLGVLAMAISEGTTITLIADGPDETDALNGLEEVVETEE
ncbi:MAG: HPr family phosphocarrier protein [Ruminococcus sp.]|nr:HPr family phosphocarrier protein [Candidatus Apopatosoma intestinale]